MEEESSNKVRLQEEEIHRRNMERVSQIRMMQEMGNKTYIRASEPALGVSRGFYENKVFFPDPPMYGGSKIV